MNRTKFPVKRRRTKFPSRNDRIRLIYPEYNWFEVQQPPYDQSQGEKLYNNVLWRERMRICRTNPQSPASALEDIACEINARVKITVHEVFKIGELLCIAKGICQQEGRGFQDWIHKTFKFSYPLAINFMNVYKQCMGLFDVAVHVHVSILYKISGPSFPEELRTFLLTQGNLEEITCSHVDNLYKKYKEGGYKFEAIADDINNKNHKQNVFRQTQRNINYCQQMLRVFDSLYNKLDYRTEYGDIEILDETDLEPESHQIQLLLFQIVVPAIDNLKQAIKESKKILDQVSRDINLSLR